MVPARVRDQIFTIMEDCHTLELNLDFDVPGVGYTRQFRTCVYGREPVAAKCQYFS